MADDGGEDLCVHSVLQSSGSESVPQAMEVDVSVLGLLQHDLKAFTGTVTSGVVRI